MLKQILDWFKSAISTKEKIYWFKGFGYKSDTDEKLMFLQTIGVQEKNLYSARQKALKEMKQLYPDIPHIFVSFYD
jgi:hypothetical protein